MIKMQQVKQRARARRRAAETEMDKRIRQIIRDNPGKTEDEYAEILAQFLAEEIIDRSRQIEVVSSMPAHIEVIRG
jgi:hypothetical protein